VASGSGQNRAKRVVFAGRVQGVGFRVTTREIARQYPVTGYVRNQPDGTVEVVVTGAEESIREFVDAVARRFQANISAVSETPLVVDRDYESFEIDRT